MDISIIIQARIGSSRLPGKVLERVARKPILQYVVERVARCRGAGVAVVATSTEAADDPIAKFCEKQNVACFRGPLEDVAERFRRTLEAYPCDAFVRVNADSPLLDPHIVDRGIDLFRRGGLDLVTNTFPRTYPSGQSVEVVNAETFRRACEQMRDPEDREHVTRYFYRNADAFRILNFTSGRDCTGVHMAVDEPRHLKTFAAIVARMQRPHWEYPLGELLELYDEVAAEPAGSGA